MAYRQIENTNLEDKGCEIIKRSIYERTHNGKKETLTSERKYDFSNVQDRKEMFAMISKSILFGPLGIDDAVKAMKEEFAQVPEEMYYELPFC